MRHSLLRSVRWLWLLLPVAVLPLLAPSGESHSWYEVGKGWPWHYGWQATDIRATPWPSIVSTAAFVADLLVGLLAMVVLWLLAAYWCAKRKHEN